MIHGKWIVVLLLLAGCSTSYITTSWKTKDASPKNYKKILVLGLINEPDRSIGEKMEKQILIGLKELGYDAIASSEEYPPGAFDDLGEQQALKSLDHTAIDAVLTIVLLEKIKETYYAPDRVGYAPYYYDRLYPEVYYDKMNTPFNWPGHYTTDTKYLWETNFYDLETTKLIYSVQSQSFNPISKKFGYTYGKLIINDMLQKNLLQSSKEKQLKSF